MRNNEISMDWVHSFYERQNQWSNIYADAIDPWHREMAESIILPGRKPPYRVLELGCGGGQIAASLADLGHEVVAIDINPDAILHAQRLATSRSDTHLTLIKGDFYAFDPEGRFDAICYFDGFGIGTDEDQQRLLHRVASWLQEDGRAFIEIYTPWYWKRVAGTEMTWSDASRRYGYDDAGSRMLDTWWETGHPSDTVTQSLRCYSPAELESLLDDTKLELLTVQPGGAYDHKTLTYRSIAPLEEAMRYIAVLGRE